MVQVLSKTELSAEEEVMEAFHLWLAALNRHDAEAVAAMYHPQAVLLATLNPIPCTTPAAISNYFLTIMALANIRCTPKTHLLRMHGETAVLTGTYAFSFHENGAPRSFVARFSFTFGLGDAGWRIISQHSSRTNE